MSWNLKEKIGFCIIATLILLFCPNAALEASGPLQARLEDGVVIKVHLQAGLEVGDSDYSQEVLQAACGAYREIVLRQGFDRAGFTFASASRLFAYDSDKTIDIYIADVEAPFALMAPEGGLEYKAKVFVPADYEAYRSRYKIDQPHLELKASLTHELLHLITYSYNRNMQTSSQGKLSLTSQRWDWYTEGLARYFETLAGYREEFLSSGFRRDCGGRILVYKGGVNYFLRYPDKPLNERKYDFALFWQYLHQNYGMDKIEELSVKFRDIDPACCSNQKAMQIVAETLGTSLETLLQDFSLYIYEISSVPAKKEDGLRAVCITKLSARPNQEVASDIYSFGYDYYEIDLKGEINSCQLSTNYGREGLNCLLAIFSPSSFMAFPVEPNNAGKIEIDTEGFSAKSKMIIILSNPTDQTIFYRISLN